MKEERNMFQMKGEDKIQEELNDVEISNLMC